MAETATGTKGQDANAVYALGSSLDLGPSTEAAVQLGVSFIKNVSMKR